MRRPLVPLVIAFLLGIMAVRLLQCPAPIWLFTGVAAAALALLSAAYRRLRVASAFLLLLFFSLGAGRLGVEPYLLPPHHIDRLPEEVLEQPLLIEGVVASPGDSVAVDAGGVEDEARRVRIVLDLRTMWLAGREIEVIGRARLTLPGSEIVPAYGERIRGQFKLRRPRGYLNPGGFDYPLYLRSQGVTLEGWAGEASPIERRGTGGGSGPLAFTYALRDRMIQAVNSLLPPEQASLLVAMTLGERSDIPRRITEAFAGSGTYHILAISGLNVSILAGALFFLLKAVRVPLRPSALISMGLITFYAALAGGSASVVRAAVMADVYLLGLILDREADSLNTLALSAFWLLLWQPLFLFDVGFQLTFVATGAILVAVDRLPLASLSVPWRWVATPVLLSVAAFLGTAPILASTFHRISPIGILANLPIVPLSGLLTGAGMLFAVLATVIPGSLGWLATLMRWLIDLLTFLAGWFAGLPFASIQLFSPSIPMAICYYLALGAAMAAMGRRWLRWTACAAALAFVVLIGVRLLPIFQNGQLRMTVLDIGQGDAIVLELPGKRAILIDGGGLFDDRFDVGEQVVVPFLLSRWIGHLDVVVLSHPHPDHLNGLQAVLRHFPIGQVWDSGQRAAIPTYLWFEEVLRDRRIPHKILEAGYQTSEFAPVQIAVLHPSNPMLYGSPRGRFSDVNSNSLVLTVKYGKVTFLLPGDIEQEAEQLLLERGADLAAQVLKVPHHGGRTSSSEPFLTHVHPRVAVVSAGYRNRFRHPHQETLDRYRTNGVNLYRTDLDGAVTVTSDGNTVNVATFRQSNR
ncbi:MAG: DNA internalization-related competence protein ComEC/Rec2 [candidate division NC10 bacterium]|nr:DNA internalization-related competence protein ComEC/Rec2 [candidate division NC10 bacterium]MDE2322813.1 DNA internalization-related competence protein ComEC/Rec2 [candidate division NC10 bacterium]